MSCQCEIYEICPQCAPSQDAFLKVVKVHDNVVRQHRVSASKSYTLDDLQRLAEEYASEIHDLDHALTPRLVLSIFIEWARKREREVENGA